MKLEKGYHVSNAEMDIRKWIADRLPNHVVGSDRELLLFYGAKLLKKFALEMEKQDDPDAN